MIKRLFLNDKFILGLIFINAIILFVGGYQTTGSHCQTFLLADNILTTLFIVELIVKFKASYKGQMELYLRYLEKHDTEPGEESPIGLILYAEGNQE